MAGPGISYEEGPEISLADFAAQIAGAVGLQPDEEWSSTPSAEPVGVYSEEQERQVEERLRGLGYLE
jgi:protein-disulfide isomerase-like protein with CxxC motif